VKKSSKLWQREKAAQHLRNRRRGKRNSLIRHLLPELERMVRVVNSVATTFHAEIKKSVSPGPLSSHMLQRELQLGSEPSALATILRIIHW
jgi:hypothetical protein